MSASPLAEAIRSSIRVGNIGPNSAAIIERGGSVHLTPQEAEDAAARIRERLPEMIETPSDLLSDECLDAAARAYHITVWGDDLDPEAKMRPGETEPIRAAIAAALRQHAC